MAITPVEFFYDAQIRRYLEQVVRGLSGFHYETGRRNGNAPELRMVPCRLASADRMTAQIMRNLSENTLLTVPQITVWMTELTFARDRMQSTTHVDTRHVHERSIANANTNAASYRATLGNTYTVRRLMPRPFDAMVQVDIWASNLLQKHQIMEQVLTVFAPDIQIQNSDNALDWSAITQMSLENVSWSSRTIPIGTDTDIDTTTLTFKLPLWLNPPAEVKAMRRIEQIVANVGDLEIDAFDDRAVLGDRWQQSIITPGQHRVAVSGADITLLGPDGGLTNPAANNAVWAWSDLFQTYGRALRPTLSQIRLKTSPDGIEDWSSDLIGTVQATANANVLQWTLDIDTLPANTLSPIDGIVDPLRTSPGSGLPPVANGQRYLLLNDIGNGTVAWGTINGTGRAGDILQYNAGLSRWDIPFVATNANTVQYVLNTTSGRQLRWTGSEWVLTVDGEYAPGYWRLNL